MVYFTGISEDDFWKIVEHCRRTGWQESLSSQRAIMPVDVAPFYLTRQSESMQFGWADQFAADCEIQCPVQMKLEIEAVIGKELQEGKPEALEPERVQRWLNYVESEEWESSKKKHEKQCCIKCCLAIAALLAIVITIIIRLGGH